MPYSGFSTSAARFRTQASHGNDASLAGLGSRASSLRASGVAGGSWLPFNPKP